MQEYVVGFLHNHAEVVLIRKNRPEWQDGLLNGVGGHIEEYDDGPCAAMVREFKEETGVDVPRERWQLFVTLEGPKAKIYCYASEDKTYDYQLMRATETKTDEDVGIYSINWLNMDWDNSTVPNLKWIIPMMQQRANYAPVTVKFHGDN